MNQPTLVFPRHRASNTPVKYQWIYNLTAANSLEFEALTFPNLKKHWQTFRQRGSLGGVAAFVKGQMVGLILAEQLPQTAEILSFYVMPEYRHQGIGIQLIQYLEKGLIQLKCPKINLKYRVSDLTTLALESILQKQGWEIPKTEFILVKSDKERMIDVPWLNKYPFSKEFTVFPWIELTGLDRDDILQRKTYPDVLSPFSEDPRLEPLNSLGLRYQGKIIGWVINHRVAPDTIRYSIMFVEKPFQKLGRGISLVIESVKLQINNDIPYGTLAVASDNQPMLRWVERYLKPYATLISESRYSCRGLI